MRRLIARVFLRLSGWAFESTLPRAPRYVLIAAPHTSNWDFVFMIAMAWSLRVRLHWMGKASLFAPPYGGLFRAAGGLPIRRGERGGIVEQVAERFRRAAQDGRGLVLAVPAEGTRERRTHWRSGFYHIARLAEVPVVLGYLDYARRRGGLGPALHPSGDVRADMDRVRAFYADKVGKFPERFTPPRLLEEEEDERGGEHPAQVEGRTVAAGAVGASTEPAD